MKNSFFYIKKRLQGCKRILFLNILTISISLAIISIALTIPLILKHCEKTIKKSLDGDISEYGVIRNGNNAITNESIGEYISEIMESEEIEAVGTWDRAGFGYMKTVGDVDYWTEIQRVHAKHHLEFDEGEEDIPFIFMLRNAFSINKINLYAGGKPTEETSDEWLLYLGYNYRTIPLNTLFSNEDNGMTYRVMGIMDKNTSVVDEQAVLWNLGGLKYSCTICLDNMVMVIPPKDYNYHSENYFFRCAEGYSFEDAEKRINCSADRYGIQTEIGQLDTRVRVVLTDIKWLQSQISQIAVFLFGVAIIITITMQILVTLKRKRELGVWLLTGLSKRRIFGILLAENLLKTGMGIIPALVIIYMFWKQWNLTGSVVYELRVILYGGIPIILLASGFILSAVGTAITFAFIADKRAIELIQKTWY